MPKIVSGKELIKFLSGKGFEIYSRKGSHVKLINIQRHAKTVVPMHKEIVPSTLRSVIRQARLTKKEIQELKEA